jgi:hypothetical protein
MSLAFLTLVGGGGFDTAADIAVDGTGSVWITGWTESIDFPTTTDALQISAGGCENEFCVHTFVTKMNSSTGALTYSTYLGRDGAGSGIAADVPGNVYVTGDTRTSDFPTTVGAFDTKFAGFSDAFIAKFGSDSAFDLCLQDESNGNLLRINSNTGDYQFTNCRGLSVGGTASLTRRGSVLALQATGSDRRLLARLDTCMKSGTASIQVFSQGTTLTILDRNTANNTCVCSR